MRLLIKLIKGYQTYISPYRVPSCRFIPTCSEYAVLSLQKKGLFLGIYLSTKRLLSCHPFRSSKVDEVSE